MHAHPRHPSVVPLLASAWNQDPQGVLDRVDRFLAISAQHHKLYNEPYNSNKQAYGKIELPDKAAAILPLLEKVFGWARAAGATQPPTAASVESGLDALASADDHRAGIVAWNQTASDLAVSIHLNNLPFQHGRLRLYRVDHANASHYDGGTEDLAIVERQSVSGSSTTWTGRLPAHGTIYLVVSDAQARADFTAAEDMSKPATFSIVPRVCISGDSSVRCRP